MTPSGGRSGREAAVVRTGTANLASVLAGLRRAGADPFVAREPGDLERAGRIVLPGVGAFGAAMQTLEESGMRESVRRWFAEGRPALAVCLGLQLLGSGSEESPGVEGLGVVPPEAGRFEEGVRVPQLGWNRVEPSGECRLLEGGYAYFANSYRLETAPVGWKPAWSDHGGPFIAALERGPVLACQFHPELSGAWGQALLVRWLDTAVEGVR
ncbi:MAG: imidazole glycerol phosphate synthase subunit HisH [bacterium]